MVRLASWHLAGGACLLLLSGCVTPEQAQVMERDIRRLQAEVSTLKESSERTQGGGQAVLQEVKGLREDLERLRRTQADLEARLQTTLRSTATATGELEKAQFLAGKASREVAELQKGLEGRLVALEKDLVLIKNNLGFRPALPPPRPEPSPTPPAGGIPPPLGRPPEEGRAAVVPAPPPISEERRLYDRALELARAGKLPEARKELEAFLKLFPKSELADDAQYSIGESYFTEKRYEKAILEFDKVVINYAKGDKVASALLKQGYAFLALGDKTSARQLLTQVVDRHPDSPEAKEARSRLEGL